MDSIVEIRQFNSATDEKELLEAAHKDGHEVYLPTHVYVKEGRIVGYLSINMLPTVLSWQSSEDMGPSDSLEAIGYIKGSLQNFKYLCIPCDPDSPYMKFLPKCGFKKYTKPVELWIKSNVQENKKET